MLNINRNELFQIVNAYTQECLLFAMEMFIDDMDFYRDEIIPLWLTFGDEFIRMIFLGASVDSVKCAWVDKINNHLERR